MYNRFSSSVKLLNKINFKVLQTISYFDVLIMNFYY